METKKKVEIKEALSAFLLAVGWMFVLFSIAVYLLFWRVDNEPGATPVPGLLVMAILLLSTGALSIIINTVYLIVKKSWVMMIIAGLLCLVILFGACNLSPILLLLLV
ncbi:MAG: hypothetical protein GY832_12885 [Chloroflexi bacterium]|nr:hypothetical protein [Chloroflexota bacterium]